MESMASIPGLILSGRYDRSNMTVIQRWLVFLAIYAGYAGWTCGLLSAQGFSYGGISLATPVAALPARFPHSQHTFTAANGTNRSIAPLSLAGARGRGGEEVTPEQLAAESARYYARLEARDATSLIYYISAELQAGRATEYRLGFDQGDAGPDPRGYTAQLARFERRHPACALVPARIEEQFGKHRRTTQSREEALEDTGYHWTSGGTNPGSMEEMTLHCGRYQGRRARFAMELVLERR